MNITLTHDVAMVTVNNIPNDTGNLVKILSTIADLDVNIDMISQTAPLLDKFNLSFSLSQSDPDKIMEATKTFKKISPSISTEINGYNAKITFKSEKMKDESGTASSIFSQLYKNGVSVKMITTAETEISCLIDEKDASKFKI